MIQRQPMPAVASPSLVGRIGARGPAYELKFMVSEAEALELADWLCAEARLAPDPCADPEGEMPGTYTTTTLYLDTAGGDVFRRAPGFRTQKFRVRRYAGSGVLFLERKRKSGGRVSKRRAQIPEEELGMITGASTSVEWPGHWFQRMVRTRRLRPAACMRYQRTALVGDGPEGPVRVTMDRAIRGVATSAWEMADPGAGAELLPGVVVLELKFIGALPCVYKRAMEQFRLDPTGISKYRLWRARGAAPFG
jgi:hypothetical protein